MIRPRPVFALFRKELLESARDWKTLVLTYGLPIVVYPLLIVWASEAHSIRRDRESHETYRVAVLGEDVPGLREALAQAKQVEIVRLDAAHAREIIEASRVIHDTDGKSGTSEKARTILAEQHLSAALVAWPAGSNSDVELLYDDSDGVSSNACDRVANEVAALAKHMRETRLQAQGLSPAFIEPLKLKRRHLETASQALGRALGGPLVSFILVILCINCYYPALGATIGERERGTLLGLLSTPARETELVAGKFLSTLLMGLLGLFAYAVPLLLLAWTFRNQGGGSFEPGAVLHLLAGSYLRVLPLILSGTAVIAALSISLGLWAKTQAEAQSYLTTLMLTSVGPAFMTWVGGSAPSVATAAIPLFNLNLLTQTSSSGLHLTQILIAIAVNLLAAAFVLAFAAQLLRGEIRGQYTLVETHLVPRLARPPRAIRRPTVDLAFLFFFGTLAAFFQLELLLGQHSPYIVLCIGQLGLIAGVPALLAWKLKLDWRTTFKLRAPRLEDLAAAWVIAAGGVVTFGWLSSHLPFPKELVEQTAAGLNLGGPAWRMVLLMGVLPGICEEIAFRGFILSGLSRRFAPAWAIAIDAALFGLMHVSMIRILPTMVIGSILAFVATRTRSVAPGIFIHAMYNSGLLLLAVRGASVPPWLAVAGAVAIAAGLVWIIRDHIPERAAAAAAATEDRAA